MLHREQEMRTILLCTDMSSEAKRAIEFSVTQIVKPGDTVIALFADQESQRFQDQTAFGPIETNMDQIHSHINFWLKRQGIQDVRVRVTEEKGDPKKLIMEYIQQFHPFCVVLGSRGHSSIKGMILGSVSNYILAHSPVPVIIYRSGNE